MLSPIKTGLVGFGVSARTFHAPYFETMPEYEMVSVVERNSSFAKEKYPAIKQVRSFEDLLGDPGIELVVITTPNETHFPYSKLALQAGKHVVVEKPFTNTSAEAMQLVELSRNSDRILSIYHNRRYVSDFFTIREILDKKLLGEVHEFIGHYDRYRLEERPEAWREKNNPGSGILYDLGSHLIDQSLCFFGLPKNITADIRLQRPHAKVDDYFDLWLDYGFLKVILKAGMLVREPGPRYKIHGTIGSFVKYGEDPQEAKLKAGKLPVEKDFGKEPEEIYGILHTVIDGKLVRETYPSHPGDFSAYYKNLYATIRNGAELKEKPEQGFNTIRIIELAFESNARKCMIRCTGLME